VVETNGGLQAEDEAASVAALFQRIREERTWGTLLVEWKNGKVVSSEFKLACRSVSELAGKLGIPSPSEGEPVGGPHGRTATAFAAPQHLSR
jgi:hypothetical protein